MEFKKGITMEKAFEIMKKITNWDDITFYVGNTEINIGRENWDKHYVEIGKKNLKYFSRVYSADIFMTAHNLHIGNAIIAYAKAKEEN